MLRFFYSICLVFFSITCWAQSYYQVDVILFASHYASNTTEKPLIENISPIDLDSAIPLDNTHMPQTGGYQLLATSSSKLQYMWYRLGQLAEYQPLAHYTWRQPSHNQHAVRLPRDQTYQGWHIDGTIRVRQSQYYLLDTQIVFKAPYRDTPTFILSQQMRLKPGQTYYLDHPQGGMLINVHRV